MSHSKLLALLSDEERQRLSPYIREVKLHLHQELLEAGSPIHSVYLPHDCVTSTIVDNADGTTIEVGLMGYEGLVGISAILGKSVSNTTVIVQIAGTASQMLIEDFSQHVVHERSELFTLLLQYTDGSWRWSRKRLRAIAFTASTSGSRAGFSWCTIAWDATTSPSRKSS